MNAWTRRIGLALMAAATVWWLSGCSSPTSKKDTPHATKPGSQKEAEHKEGDEHKEGAHKEGGHKEGAHEAGHDDKPLTEKDIKMPDSFKAGAARLEELNKKIDHHIEHGELSKVHHVAEEMALVANGMKKLAAKDVPEDKQTEAGRLCNEVAGYYKPIDEAADAGKKADTEAIYKKMVAAVEKLKALAK